MSKETSPTRTQPSDVSPTQGPTVKSTEPEIKHRYTPTPVNEPETRSRPKFLPRLPNPLKYLRRLPFWAYLVVLGPGVISAAAGNDAGGIATYASAGAAYGYNLLWAMLLITVSLALVQEMCARMGAVTGKGLSDLIREQFGASRAMLAMVVLLIANTGVTISEFVGIAAVAQLFGIPTWLAVPPIAVLIWWMITGGSYRTVEKVFMGLSLIFFTYVVAAFMAKPDWGEVGRSFLHPTISFEPTALQALVALIGTTITPYMQLFVQSSVVEKGVTLRDYKYTRFDTVFGVVLANAVSVFIIIATAATLHVNGVTQIDSAADAAKALEPVAGQGATLLFALGLFGASMLAAGVLPLATAFSVTESLGFEKGVSLSFREAPVFMGLFTVLVAIGAVVAMIPGLPLFPVLIAVQILNGVLLPILLVFIVRLASNRDIMGKYAIGPVYKLLAWATVVVITVAVVLMLGTLFIH
ncbi:MAG: Nramp family divalent metal transporter [Chloroflexota bacterium]